MPANPLLIFDTWYQDHLHQCQLPLPSACCLSTVGLDGFPNARFVSLKEVVQEQFIVTGPTDSRKGQEIAANGQVALTFWWAETERQVRVQGVAKAISEAQADTYFAERNHASQAVSVVCQQGQPLTDMAAIEQAYGQLNEQNQPIARPNAWGGWAISPHRIELMAFKHTRFHERWSYERVGEYWEATQLQP